MFRIKVEALDGPEQPNPVFGIAVTNITKKELIGCLELLEVDERVIESVVKWKK